MNPPAANPNSSEDSWAREVENRDRFQFGANWASFLHRLTPERIERAEQSLSYFLGDTCLECTMPQLEQSTFQNKQLTDSKCLIGLRKPYNDLGVKDLDGCSHCHCA